MGKTISPGNPYNHNGAADFSRLFFGRQDLFAWILEQTEPTMASNQPIILLGEAKIGKTAVLKQIESGALNPPFVGIYIDFAQIALDSLSALYGEIATAGQNALARLNLELDTLNHTDFIADPPKALHQQFLLPTAKLLKERRTPGQNSHRRPLFLFDNTHLFLEQVENGVFPPNSLEDLHLHLTTDTEARAIFAMPQAAFDLHPEPFHNQSALVYNLPPLTEDETIALVRQPVTFTLVQDVAQYIFHVTNGHPHKTHQLCHALYEHQQQYDLTQITVADVATVHKFSSAKRMNGLPGYELRGSRSVKQAFRLASHWDFLQNRSFYLLLVAALLLLVSGFLFTAAGSSPISQRVAGFLGATTPTGTAVPPTPDLQAEAVAAAELLPTDTPMPTDTPTATPTETPSPTPTPTATATNRPTATPDRYPATVVRENDGMMMVLIPAGTFMMGAAEDDFAAGQDERPQHEVRLSQFYIDKYEVNVEQYAAFLNRLGAYVRACEGVDCAWPRELAGYTSYLVRQDLGDGTVQYFPLTGFANYPINHVSWHGAKLYCESVGGRLPTEAEWEYAARGTDGRIYPWGNTQPDPEGDRAVFQSDSYENLKPVDALPNGASPFGVFGMAGSLWEWTADWYSETWYTESNISNPTGPETGFARVIRGGAWPFNNQADRIRTTNRSSLTPDFISSAVGFRCVREP